MVGILLLTHKPLGQAFIEAATHIFRSVPENLEAIDVYADQEPAEVKIQVKAAVSRLNQGKGVLILTDMVGGTPANCLAKSFGADQIEIIAGISLPMLLRALTYRHESLAAVAEKALAGGQKGVVRVSD